MRIDASVILISCLALPATPVAAQTPGAAQTRNVDLTAADGVVLKASYSSPGKPGPGILLFHQCSENGSRRLAVGGSSCGAADAVDLAARRHDIRAVVLLSGLPSLGGKAYLAATPLLPVFGIYAEQDLGAEAMRSTIVVSKHPRSTLKMFSGSGHGVELFEQHPDLQLATVKWLQDQVGKP